MSNLNKKINLFQKKKLLILDPLNLRYLNKTRENYKKIFLKLNNSFELNIKNYKNKLNFLGNPCIYFPQCFAGYDLQSYKDFRNKIKERWIVDYIPTFEEFHDYTISCIRLIENSEYSISFLLEYDKHNFINSNFQKNFVDKFESFMILNGGELYDFQLFKDKFEQDINRKFIKSIDEFHHKQRHRIISAFHVIDIQKSTNSNLKLNNLKLVSRFIYSITIGASYILRKKYLTKLFEEKQYLGFLTSLLFLINYKLSNKFVPLKYRVNWLIIFQKIILSRSKFCFVCGSTNGYPIRKYLEVPQSGSVLLTPNYKFLKNIGFYNKRNFIEFNPDKSSIEDLLQIDTDQIKKIVKNTENILLKKHSLEARRINLEDSLLRIEQKRFYGSFWFNGNYEHYDN